MPSSERSTTDINDDNELLAEHGENDINFARSCCYAHVRGIF